MRSTSPASMVGLLVPVIHVGAQLVGGGPEGAFEVGEVGHRSALCIGREDSARWAPASAARIGDGS